MKKKEIDYSVYLVTEALGDRALTEWLARLESVLELGVVTCVQFREKVVADGLFEEMLEGCKVLCEGRGLPVIVNDPRSFEGLSSVHVGSVDLACEAREVLGDAGVVGLSVRNLEEAERAVGVGVDYWGVGPVFRTRTKEDASAAIGLEGLREVVAVADVPVVGIGGIEYHSMGDILDCGAVGTAMVSGLYDLIEKMEVVAR